MEVQLNSNNSKVTGKIFKVGNVFWDTRTPNDLFLIVKYGDKFGVVNITNNEVLPKFYTSMKSLKANHFTGNEVLISGKFVEA